LEFVHQNILASTKETKVQNARLDETKSKIEDRTVKFKEICEKDAMLSAVYSALNIN